MNLTIAKLSAFGIALAAVAVLVRPGADHSATPREAVAGPDSPESRSPQAPTLSAVSGSPESSVIEGIEARLQSMVGQEDLGEEEMALALIVAIPDLPTADRPLACEQALLLLGDESYQPAFDLLASERGGELVGEILMDDLLGRSPFLHLPYLVRLASLEDHPYSEDARSLLELVVGDDYGTNWSGWSDAVATLLESSEEAVGGVSVLQ